MKKNVQNMIRMAALAMVGAAITACSSIDDEQTATTGKTVVLKGQLAPKGGDNTTRSFGWDDEKGYAQWVGDEEVAVYYQTSTGYATATAKLTDDDGSFEAELVDAVSGEVKFVYPAALHDGEGNYQTTGIALQDGTIEGLSLWDIATGQATMTVNGSEATLGDNLTLDPQVGVFRFTLKDEDGFDVSPDKLEIQIGEQLAYTITPTEAGNILYAAMLPAENANFTFTATKGNVVYTKSSESVTIATGKFYSGDLVLEPNVTDLSMVDCAGNARTDGRWTANCYMVHHIGQYKLPLVYGNAIKAGQTNAAAYTGIESNNTTLTFPNHTGQPITAPWIKDNGITVTSAELLWQDAQGLVTAVGIDGDYLTLAVGKDATTQEGNALVAAKDANGTIVWSWHIWVTKQTFAASTLTAVNTGDHTYTLTPVNLGWVGNATSPSGYNTYYQWGRKDAFIPSTGTDNTNHTVYNIDGTAVTNPIIYSTSSVGIDGNIKNPMTFYNVSNISYWNLWDAQQTSMGNNISTATIKTVYDPCPAGFCIPTGNLYNYFQGNNKLIWDSTIKGRITTSVNPSVFFPASGYRKSNNGTLNDVGVIGCYWAAKPVYTDGCSLVLGSNNALWTTYSRDFGFSVRAVVEE